MTPKVLTQLPWVLLAVALATSCRALPRGHWEVVAVRCSPSDTWSDAPADESWRLYIAPSKGVLSVHRFKGDLYHVAIGSISHGKLRLWKLMQLRSHIPLIHEYLWSVQDRTLVLDEDGFQLQLKPAHDWTPLLEFAK